MPLATQTRFKGDGTPPPPGRFKSKEIVLLYLYYKYDFFLKTDDFLYYFRPRKESTA